MARSPRTARPPLYRRLAPELPDIGWAGPLPLALTEHAARAIHACDDAVALGVMLGQLRSYWAAMGGIAMTVFGGLAAGAAGWQVASIALFLLGIPTSLATIEARRRATQWQGVVEARLITLTMP